MSVGKGGPRQPGRGGQPARGSRVPPGGSRAPQGSRGREAERQRQAQSRRQRNLLIGGIAALVVVLVVVLAVVAVFKSNNSASPAATPTVPASNATAVSASPVPTTAMAATLPTAAEKAASLQACAPFLKAGNQPKGKEQWGAPPQLVLDKAKHYSVTIYTDAGAVSASLLADKAPITSNNFIFLSCNGFYDNVIFHRTIKDFMIQGGDPTGTGTGGPGYSFQDELGNGSYTAGTLAMANSGANTNGSQFFIVQGAQGASLDQQPNYSIFGHVTAGQNVVDAIASAPVHAAAQGGETSAPDKPVRIRAVTVQVS